MFNCVFRKFSNSLVQQSVQLTGLTAISKGANLLIPFFLADWFGTGGKMDSFFFAYGIIIFISTVVTSTISSAIVPALMELKTRQSDPGRFIGNLFIMSGIGILLFQIATIVAFHFLIPIATDLDKPAEELIGNVLVGMSPVLLFLVLSSVIDGVFNANEKYILPAITPAFRSIITICVIFIFRRELGVHSITLGYIAGEFIRFLVLVVGLNRGKLVRVTLYFTPSIDFRRFVLRSMFQIAAMVLTGINPVIDRSVASWLGEGNISILFYADRLYILVFALLTNGIGVVFLSHMSRVYHSESFDVFKRKFHSIVRYVSIIALCIQLLLVFLAAPIVEISFMHGEFDGTHVSFVQSAFVAYMIGFLPAMLVQVYGRVFLIMNRTRMIFICAALMVGLNVALDFILMRFFGTAGIAAATSIVHVFMALFYVVAFWRESKRHYARVARA